MNGIMGMSLNLSEAKNLQDDQRENALIIYNSSNALLVLLNDILDFSKIEAGKLALENNTPCHVSLESPMACGLGICFSCVVKVKTEAEGGWDYKRICVDGPVFNAETLVLE